MTTIIFSQQMVVFCLSLRLQQVSYSLELQATEEETSKLGRPHPASEEYVPPALCMSTTTTTLTPFSRTRPFYGLMDKEC